MRYLFWLMILFFPVRLCPVAPLSICRVLQACRIYEGKTILVEGRYFANRHVRAFSAPCQGERTDQPFAVADWTRYQGDPPDIDSIIRDRDPQGRPSSIDGLVTALVKVKCDRDFHVSQDLTTGEQFGNGESYNGLGAVRLYIKRIKVRDTGRRDSRSR
jgi:hypothetical protein